MYAIVETGGKQYTVSEGDHVRVEKLAGDVGSEIALDRVLLVGDDDNVTVGRPVVDGAKVMGRITAHGRGRKLIVFKTQRRQQYSRKQGHRQSYTEVEVTGISA